MQVEVVDIENNKYFVMKKINNNNETYLFLSNVKNPYENMIRKIDKKDSNFLIPLDNEDEFNKVIKLFNFDE